jgi:PAS domain S-box-containing protein
MKTLEQYVKKGHFYQSVVDDGSDIIFIVDFTGIILYHNNSVRETLGYRSKSLIGKNFLDYVLPQTLGEFSRKFKLTQRKAYSEKIEFQFLCKDRSYRFLEFNAINLKHQEGLAGLILDCRDITQRKRDAEELVRLQKAKEQFLANISHEIRTPINGIAGLANLLTQNLQSEDLTSYLNAIQHSAENLKVIINDILDLSAIESGKLKFEKIAFNLNDLLPPLINTFSYQAKEKQVSLSYSIDEKLNTILLGDPVRLNQILINLIGNAVKFTNHGSIQVYCSYNLWQRDICWVRIEVRDTGVGIAQEKLNTIFESFSQADESVTRLYGGTGLGLTIVKQLVELQNGKIAVDSVEHHGSAFTVTIPYPIGKSKKLKELSKRSTSFENHPGKNLRVLLVEDNDINRLYAKSILKNWQSHTETAENGLVAIEKVKNMTFDVILMDVQMPVLDGYETTRAIRNMEVDKRRIPIVALTANATKTDVDKCLKAGMDAFLPKPFTPEDLYQKLFYELRVVPVKKDDITTNKSTINNKSKAIASYDLVYLHDVSGNNTNFVHEMIRTFIVSIPSLLDEMAANAMIENWEKVSALAHQIKPSFVLMGAVVLRDSAAHIEARAEEKQNLSGLTEFIDHFRKQCKEMVDELAGELNN